MIKYKIGISVIIVLLFMVFLTGCQNQFGSSDGDTSPDMTASEAYVYDDPALGASVFVDESGSKTVIKSDESGETVACLEVQDFISFSNSSDSGESGLKAMVLGKRGDGRPGIWGVYADGNVSPVINSDDIETSELLELVGGRQPLSSWFGWSYEALAMAADDTGDEIIIIGYAVNEDGIDIHNYSIEAGTTVGVYWAVTKDDEGYYHISRAKVLGYKDTSEWKFYSWKEWKNSRHSRHRWMWVLRLFFAGWYDKYLVMPESVDKGDNDGEFLVYGTDQDDVYSVAVVTARKVLGIDEAEDDDESDNHAPYAVIGPSDVYHTNNNYLEEYSFYLETDSPDGSLDPDGDDALFYSSLLPEGIILDPETGEITISNPPFPNGDYEISLTVWTMDEYGLQSVEFPVVLHISGSS